MKLILRFFGLLIKASLGLLAIAIPMLGAWVGSSLAAFLNGPRWVAPLVALLAFPIVPLLWDAWARRKRDEDAKSILTFVDRMTLRTLTLNVVFLGAFFFFSPKTVFTSMSARGDWMLDDAGESSTVESIRSGLFSTVDALEWAFGGAVSDNAYEDLVEDDEAPPPPDLRESIDERHAADVPDDLRPAPPPRRPDAPDTPDAPDSPDVPESERPDTTTPSREAPADESWPFEHTLHPAIASIPSSAESSIAALAQYVTRSEDNKFQRVKALHDWVAAHVRYDVPLLRAIERGERPDFSSQQAENVFRGRIGVCAGYANLMKALGEAANIEIEVVTGHTRQSVGGVGHAWNAVKIEERWYLMDATWNAGHVEGDSFTPEYSTDFFLTPAGAFGRNHFPENPDWQLLAEPISRAEFMRLPNLRPSFFERGLALQSPNRSQVTVEGSFSVRIDNPQRQWVMIAYRPKNGGESVQCGISNDAALSASCPMVQSGFYTLHFLVGEQQFGQYQGVGEIEVVRR